jgi:energy-coupling factor transporter transmembrane protein EcfT
MARLGPVSSLDPSCKLLCLALLSSASLLARPASAAVLAIAAIVLLVSEGVRLSTVARDSSFVLAFAIVTAFLRLLGDTQASEGSWTIVGGAAAYCLKLLAAFMAGRLFYATTGVSELRDAATRFARRLPGLRRFDLGLGISMVIGFIPAIFDEWNSSLEAARSRGMRRRPGLSRQAQFIAAVLRRLMLRAVATPEALMARGWYRERGLAASRWKKIDTAVSISCLGILAASILRIV